MLAHYYYYYYYYCCLHFCLPPEVRGQTYRRQAAEYASTEPHSPAPIVSDPRRGNAHIVGYYAPPQGEEQKRT
jgi:hypothetical protein